MRNQAQSSRTLPGWSAWLLLVPAGLAAVGGPPYRGEADVAAYVAARFTPGNPEGMVTPELLGRWLQEERPNLQVADVRDSSAWEEYHIPGAFRLDAVALPSAGNLVLYGETGEEGTAALDSLLARARTLPANLNVYALEGGLQGWTERILHPSIPAKPSPWARAMFEEIRPISRYLGGLPRVNVPPGQATIRDLPPRLRDARAQEGVGRVPGTFRRGC